MIKESYSGLRCKIQNLEKENLMLRKLLEKSTQTSHNFTEMMKRDKEISDKRIKEDDTNVTTHFSVKLLLLEARKEAADDEYDNYANEILEIIT